MPVSISIAGEKPANRGMLELGHAIGTTFHVTALCFGAPYLLITIPVHLIYTAVALAKHDDRVRRPNNALRIQCNGLVPTGANFPSHVAVSASDGETELAERKEPGYGTARISPAITD